MKDKSRPEQTTLDATELAHQIVEKLFGLDVLSSHLSEREEEEIIEAIETVIEGFLDG